MSSLRVALRTLARTPGFTGTAILTIALGLGTNVAIFTVVNAVLVRALPYGDPQRLVWLATWNADRGQYSKSSGWDYDSWRQRTATFEAVEAGWDRAYTITGTDHPEALVGWQFTPNLFPMLGISAALGRTLMPEDGDPGHDNVVVLSDSLWRRRFSAAPDVVGRSIQLDGQSYTIVGVMPPSFLHPYPNTQLWTPLTMTSGLLGDRKQRPLRVFARLRPGVDPRAAESELRAAAEQHARDFPDTHAGFTTSVRPLRDFYIGDVSGLLWVLQGTALILLLIASSNVASLILVRASGRQREVAIRVALGAGRMRLFRQHLVEGLTLSLAGTAAALILARWGAAMLPRLLATRLRTVPLADDGIQLLDGGVLLATAIAALGIGVLFAAAPLMGRATTIAGSLHAGGRGSTGDRRTRVLRNAILTGQIALSVSLLIGAGLLARSFVRLQRQSFGFSTDHVVTAQLQLPRDRFASTSQTSRFLGELVARIGAIPGVQGAAAINTLPLTGFNALRPYNLPGQPPQERMTEFRIVTPDYFRVMQIPVRRGRAFDDRDRLGSQDVVIVNETVARRLWPGADPIGRTIAIPDMLSPSRKTVVGVVGDTRHHDLVREPEPEIYRPAYQTYWPFFGLAVKTATPLDAVERAVRAAAAELDSSVPVNSVRPLSAMADTTWAWRRASMGLLGAFAGAAMLLAFVGVYSVMAYSVAQRSREIGVRLALGARPQDVARAVVGQGLVLASLGVVIGLGLSAVLAGLLASLLFGVSTIDPLTFVAASAVSVVAAVLASLVPAMTAARLDPTMALRSE
jgi:putative ABC transport system permease protein